MSAIKKKKDHKGFKSFVKGLENIAHINNNDYKYMKMHLSPYDDTEYVIAAIKPYTKDSEKELFVTVCNLSKIKFVRYKLQKKGVGIWGVLKTVF